MTRQNLGNSVVLYGAPPAEDSHPGIALPWTPAPFDPFQPIPTGPVPFTPIQPKPQTLDERIASFRADLVAERDAAAQKVRGLDAMIDAIDARGRVK